MKCSGKKKPYPTEIESLNKKRSEQMIADVIDQAEANKKNLTVLDEKIHSEANSLSHTFESEIGNIAGIIRSQNEEFKEQLKSLTNETNHLRVNFTKTINRVETQLMSYFRGLSSRVDSESSQRKARPSKYNISCTLEFSL